MRIPLFYQSCVEGHTCQGTGAALIRMMLMLAMTVCEPELIVTVLVPVRISVIGTGMAIVRQL